ncbi:MAG: PolC-type DNA polymerase III N-terminal domain-containing protein, partial [Agathobacter sp.]|nr:PolC-type DNA polymerase III N-terminal domain-containing protein [Agathobacter sp.]
MIKSFGETFPTLKVDSEMEHLLEKASVTKISVNHARNLYRIYLTSERLIFKKNIWKLEEAIQKQIFKSKDISVKIIESYQLSTQYTPRTLLDVYKDSILDELNSHSVLLYNLLRTAQWEFTDDTHVTLTIEETIIAKTRGNTIMEFLEKVFCERCGMDFIINIKYEKPKISKYRKNADKQIEQEVQNIIARTKFAVAGNEDIKTAENQNQDDDGSMFVEAGVSKPKNDGKMSEKVKKERKTPETSDDSSKNDRKFERKFEKRGDFRRKYDNDPDVIYGRNFDDEEITIDKIDGPIGEVVIKGQILSVETRNIRNEKTIIIFAVTDFTDTIMLKLFV